MTKGRRKYLKNRAERQRRGWEDQQRWARSLPEERKWTPEEYRSENTRAPKTGGLKRAARVVVAFGLAALAVWTICRLFG